MLAEQGSLDLLEPWSFLQLRFALTVFDPSCSKIWLDCLVAPSYKNDLFQSLQVVM